MTTPTQAQIVAAAKAIATALAPAYFEREEPTDEDHLKAAQAALTAAAEAGEESHLVSEIHRQHSEIDKLRAEKAATIERCAQVADDAANKELDAGQAALLRRIAAAIRALKEIS